MTIQPEPGHRMRPKWLPTNQTISEALYVHGMINAAIRTQGLISMITHSATLNHGGGLRKQHERVWGNPVHYGHVMGVDMAGGTALGVDLRCPTYDTISSYSRIRAMRDVPAPDPMATLLADRRSLFVTLYSRMPGDELTAVEVVPGLGVKPNIEVVTLTGESMADTNTIDEPDRITPVFGVARMTGDALTLAILPYQLVRLRFQVV